MQRYNYFFFTFVTLLPIPTLDFSAILNKAVADPSLPKVKTSVAITFAILSKAILIPLYALDVAGLELLHRLASRLLGHLGVDQYRVTDRLRVFLTEGHAGYQDERW